MGRTLPVPVSCQVCGDKSYGRHYGVYCCDGCSCFFKRSIRKAISYTCISGDNQCVIDKARRNWCPACRLQKCYHVKMNQTAVQEERGPRKHKHKEDEEGKVKRPRKETRRKHEEEPPSDFESMLLLQTLRLASQGPVLRFASESARRTGLETYWHALLLLHAASVQPPTLARLFAEAGGKVKEALEALSELALDPQEVHLCTSLILTTSQSEGEGSLRGLGELYRLMLLHHCATFHARDPLRSARVMFAVSTAMEVPQSSLGAMGRVAERMLDSVVRPAPSPAPSLLSAE